MFSPRRSGTTEWAHAMGSIAAPEIASTPVPPPQIGPIASHALAELFRTERAPTWGIAQRMVALLLVTCLTSTMLFGGVAAFQIA